MPVEIKVQTITQIPKYFWITWNKSNDTFLKLITCTVTFHGRILYSSLLLKVIGKQAEMRPFSLRNSHSCMVSTTTSLLCTISLFACDRGTNVTRSPGLTIISAWISNYMPSNVYDGIAPLKFRN